MKRLTRGLALCLAILFLSSAARAQSASTGAIAGVVRDATGAVLPGVTVEASSPALIEKVRSAATDGEGNYKIVDLRPGTYTVTFTLSGFAAVKREGIELTTGFTANASAELKVGSLQETVTVSGASPVVDIQNVRSQNVLSRQVLDTLPAPQTMMGFTTLTLGALAKSSSGTPYVDVGGSKGDITPTLSIHGMRATDLRQLYDGLNTNNLAIGGGRRQYLFNQMVVQEVVLATGSASAEIETGGIGLNAIPKDGGNRLKFNFAGSGTNSHLQANNLDANIIGKGVTAVPGVKTIYDWGAGVGGPILKDRLWFFSAARWWGASEYQPGIFFNKSTSPFTYVPDPTRPGYVDNHTWDIAARLTLQATAKQKVTLSDSRQNNCQCYSITGTTAPESGQSIHYAPMQQAQGTWNYTASNRLLFEAGVSYSYQPVAYSIDQPFPGAAGIQELSTGLTYAGTLGGFSSTGGVGGDQNRLTPLYQRASVSYVAGSHAFKVGEQLLEGFQTVNSNAPQQLGYFFLNGRPSTLQQTAGPWLFDDRIRSLGLYAQDQWTLKRLTLNLGVRFDSFAGWVPSGTTPGGPFVPSFSYGEVDNVPNFKDVTPRLGAAYDLFGNGKTAIKGSFGRYVAGLGTELPVANAAPALVVQTATRTWSDPNFAVDSQNPNFSAANVCNLTNFAANGQCGPLSNQLFGQPFRNTFYDPSALQGTGNRAYSWQGSLSIQHELRPGVSLNAGYFYTQYHNFTVTQNQAVTSASFTPYCVTAPVDGRLPGGGGNQICGLNDVTPALFGHVQNLVTQSSAIGNQEERYDGIDLGATGRFGKGALLQGGVSLGREVVDTCFLNSRPDVTASTYFAAVPIAVTTPRNSAYCRVSPPWSAGTQVKLSGIYPLPWGFEPSFTFQNLPGAQITANYNAPNALIAPTLGRNLAACGAAVTCTSTAVVALIPPGTTFLDRFSLLDLRLAKVVHVAGVRLKGIVDVYNLLNNNTILDINATYGPSWLKPTSIVEGRLLKFGVQVDF